MTTEEALATIRALDPNNQPAGTRHPNTWATQKVKANAAATEALAIFAKEA